MVCCNYIKSGDGTVTYAYGNRESDITGIITFDVADGSFTIEKEPENGTVYMRSLYKLATKYRKDFEQGIFKKKLAFESC